MSEYTNNIFQFGQLINNNKNFTLSFSPNQEIKQSLVLLNFEDNSLRVAYKLNESLIEIINSWHEKMNMIVEIEELNINIPSNIAKNDLNQMIYNSFDISVKDYVVNNFIPNFINKLTLEKSLNGALFSQPINFQNIVTESNTITLKKLKIIIPSGITNLSKPEYKPNNTWECLDSRYLSMPPELKVDEHCKSELLANYDIPSINDISSVNSNIQYINCNKQTVKFTDFIRSDIYTPFKNCTIFDKIPSDNILSEPIPESNMPFQPNTYDEYDKYEPITQTVVDLNNIIVIFNYLFLTTIVIENPNSSHFQIINNHCEYGFIKLFNIYTNNLNIIDFVKKSFNYFTFNNIDEINKTLEFLLNYIELFSKSNKLNEINNSEEKSISTYLKSRFVLDNDINNRMKFTDLYNILLSVPFIDINQNKINGFKNRLSSYLKNIGLLKKRYNDGYYYYGIREKTIEEHRQILSELTMSIGKKEDDTNNDVKLKFNKIISERLI